LIPKLPIQKPGLICI